MTKTRFMRILKEEGYDRPTAERIWVHFERGNPEDLNETILRVVAMAFRKFFNIPKPVNQPKYSPNEN